MTYSSIIPKRCNCSESCPLWPTLGYKGRNIAHAEPGMIQEKIKKQKEREKQRNGIKKTTSKLRNLSHSNDEVREGSKSYKPLDDWFRERQKEMTGKCNNCSGKTEKDSRHYKRSLAHILPKAYFPSVATHPDNWLELCFYSNSCHTNLDNKMIDLIDLNCFDLVIQKFVKIYPHIAQEERRRIPAILLEYLKVET